MPCMGQGGGGGVYILLILDLGTRENEWSASRPGHAIALGTEPTVTTG
jgi:hypothetical protein